ncbi:exo-alpha-sialidase [Candidatus Riflebacteria bacterium]
MNIKPARGNPRNSEGAFINLLNGEILFVYTKFVGGKNDDSKAVLAGRLSKDCGKSWETEKVLFANEGRKNIMSVSLLRLPDNRLALFYLRKNGLHDCRPRLRFSSDEGKSWSRPKLVVSAPGYFVLNNDRVIQLRNGRIILPCAYHRLKGEEKEILENFDQRGLILFYYSDDYGKTWEESPDWWALPHANRYGLQEPGLIELRDGRLFSWSRTDMGCQFGHYSFDMGETWSLPQPTQFRSPLSACSIKRIPETGDLLAVWNDTTPGQGIAPPTKASWGRTPLTAAISKDEGINWSRPKYLEKNPRLGYCYPAIHFSDKATVLIAYNYGGKKSGSVLTHLKVRRISISSLYS